MILVGYTVEDGGQTLIYYFAWYSAGNQCWHRWIIEERAPRRSRMRRAMDPWLIGSTEQAPRIGVPMLLGEVAVEDGGRTLVYYLAWYAAVNQCWHRWHIEERLPRRPRMP